MASYDAPGTTYDSGLFYDAVATTPRKRMAKVALNIKGLSDLQKLGRIKASHDAVLEVWLRTRTPTASPRNRRTRN